MQQRWYPFITLCSGELYEIQHMIADVIFYPC